MTLTRTQRRNLTKLADYLESLPRRYRHFDMFDYFGNVDDEIALAYARKNGGVAACGTVACAIGHGPAAGILFRPEDCSRFGRDGSAYPSWTKYTERFAHPSEGGEFDWAFDSPWVDVDNHHWGAAARIRYLLAHGVPDDFERAEKRWRKLYREFDKRYAQGGEARQGGDSAASSVHEHPVAAGHAPKSSR